MGSLCPKLLFVLGTAQARSPLAKVPPAGLHETLETLGLSDPHRLVPDPRHEPSRPGQGGQIAKAKFLDCVRLALWA